MSDHPHEFYPNDLNISKPIENLYGTAWNETTSIPSTPGNTLKTTTASRAIVGPCLSV